jgi:hypothetical protein
MREAPSTHFPHPLHHQKMAREHTHGPDRWQELHLTIRSGRLPAVAAGAALRVCSKNLA